MKGIDPKAREVAKDLARRSGLTLGEWLNQRIIDGEAEPAPLPQPIEAARRPVRGFMPPAETLRPATARGGDLQKIARALEELSDRLEASERRSAAAISGVDTSVMGVVSRLDAMDQDHAAAVTEIHRALAQTRAAQEAGNAGVREMARSEAARVEAMRHSDAVLAKLGARVEEGEERLSQALQQLSDDHLNTARRLDRTEGRVATLGGRPPALDLSGAAIGAEDAGAFRAALQALSEHLDRSDASNAGALRTLEASIAGLDARLSRGDSGEGASGALERRLQDLTTELTAKVNEARAELSGRLLQAAGGDTGAIEARIVSLTAHLGETERRSAEAIDHMGREILRVASGLGERMGQVEGRSTQALRQISGEISRIAAAVDNRFSRHEAAQAKALEKLGGEISRIAEKLAEKILSSERRSAQSIDDVGDQLGRVTERLNQRYDRAQGELAERIRLSEERTIRLLEDAQSKMDARLADTEQRSAAQAAAEGARQAAARAVEEDLATTATPPVFPAISDPIVYAEDPFAPELVARGDAERDPPPMDLTGHPAHLADTVPPGPPLAFPGADEGEFDTELQLSALERQPRVSRPPFDAAPISGAPVSSAPVSSAPVFSGPELEVAPAPLFAPSPPQRAAAPPRSTRDMLATARAAARSASSSSAMRHRSEEPPAGSVPPPALDMDPGAFLAPGGRRRRKDAVTLRTALLASGTAAALAVTGAGAVLLVHGEMNAPPERASDPFGAPPTAAVSADGAAAAAHLAANPSTSPPSSLTGDTQGDPQGDTHADRAAVALAPGASVQEPASGKGPSGPAAAAAQALYSSAVRRIEADDFGGVDDLKRAANLGDATAEFYLAKLYETGGAGLTKDLATARRWTERAATAGDPAAMHNLGLYYYEGEGGAQDAAEAARWFSRAAALGVRDSQYNLALLYSKGYGVPQNQAEAYKWYLIAAGEGDSGAKTAARALKPQLTLEAQAAAERSASAFRIQTASTIRTAFAGATP